MSFPLTFPLYPLPIFPFLFLFFPSSFTFPLPLSFPTFPFFLYFFPKKRNEGGGDQKNIHPCRRVYTLQGYLITKKNDNFNMTQDFSSIIQWISDLLQHLLVFFITWLVKKKICFGFTAEFDNHIEAKSFMWHIFYGFTSQIINF